MACAQYARGSCECSASQISAMILLLLQAIILSIVLGAISFWGVYFPYPSPLIRRYLPPRARWSERQIRQWLATGRFHRAFLRYFYRDPERVSPPGSSILAPADGLVTSTEVFNGIRYIVIALSFWDMHVQRSPVSGIVIKAESSGDEYMDGEGRECAFLRTKQCPVQKRLAVSTQWGQIAVRLVTSLAARRIELWVHENDPVARGQRIGRILLGSTVVLELPESIVLTVRIGDRVWAGETVIAQGMVAA